MKQETKDRLRGQKAAYKLRKKVEGGKATEEDRAKLAELERAWGTTGRKAKSPAPAAQTIAGNRFTGPPAAKIDTAAEPTQDDSTPSEGADDSSGPAVETPPPPPSFDAPPEPPPRVDVLPRGNAGDWRAKYRSASGDGRESTCVELAELYCGLLAKVAAFIESAGSRPLFDGDYIERRIKPQAVLVADQLLPADFAISPEMEFVATSSMLLGQGAIVAIKKRRAAAPKGQARPDKARAPLVSIPAPVPSAPPRPEETAPAMEDAPFVAPPAPPAPFVVGPDTVI